MTIDSKDMSLPERQDKLLYHKTQKPMPRLNVKKVGAIFLALIVLLIFFSRTIYEHNLPRVTAVRPQTGRLSKLEVSRGVAAHAEVENIFAAVTGIVEELLVREGETAKQGQELLRLSFDKDAAERRLADLQNSRGRISNEIQNLNLQIERINRQIEDLISESYAEEYISRHQLDSLAVDIRMAQTELRFARETYSELRDYYDRDDEARRRARLDVDRAHSRLQSLQLQQEEAERNLERQLERERESVAQREQSRQTRLADLQGEVASLQNSVRSRNLDLEGISLQEAPYRAALEDFEAFAVIAAPVSGTVLSVNVVSGELVRENQLMVSVGMAGEFVVECIVSLDNNFVIPGDIVELSNMSNRLVGTVLNVTPAAHGKVVQVGFASDQVTPGETFDITFQKDSETTFTLVPNGALRQDNDGFFVNQIRRRDGIMGMEYYLARVPVFIGDSDNRNTAIVQGITFFEPIAHICSRAISPGDVIFLENEADFFES